MKDRSGGLAWESGSKSFRLGEWLQLQGKTLYIGKRIGIHISVNTRLQ